MDWRLGSARAFECRGLVRLVLPQSFQGFGLGCEGSVCERSLVAVVASLLAVVVAAKRIQASAVREKRNGENESLEHQL